MKAHILYESSHHAFVDPLANNSEFLSDSEVSQLPVSKKKSTSRISNSSRLRSLALTLFCLRGVCTEFGYL